MTRGFAASRLTERAWRPVGVASERGPEKVQSLQRTRRGTSRRDRSPAAPLTARIAGHGLGLAAQHYVERDGLRGAALRPAGGGISWCGRRSSPCSAASAPTMSRCSWLATVSSRPSCSAWTEPPGWLASSWLLFGGEAGTGMMSWPTSLRLSSAADRQRCCAPCPSTLRSWPASSRATPSASGAASIVGPVRYGLRQRSNRPGDRRGSRGRR